MLQDTAHERVIHSLLERQAAKYAGRTYMHFEGKEFSYEEMNALANRVAGGLQKMGITKGDKVAVLVENCPESVLLMFGLSKLGAVEVPINTSHKGDIMAYMIDHSDSAILVMQKQYLNRLAPVLPKATKVKSVILLDDDGGDPKTGIKDDTPPMTVEEIKTTGRQVIDWPGLVNNDGAYQPADVIWSDPLLLMYTSGTTGVSKGVLLPQNLSLTMAERFYNFVLHQDLSENDRIYIPNPLFHAHAWHAGINLALLVGASIVLTRRFSASKYWEDIKHYNCTVSAAGGPRLPILLLAEPKPDDADNPLRVILGGPASEKLCNAFEPRFGVTIIEFYGSTELSAPAVNQIGNRKLGSCGKIHPDYEIKVVDDNWVQVPAGEPGEMLVRPIKPFTMMLEYYKMPDKTVEAWRDCWFHTGDRARIDEDNFIHFVDRKKDSLRRRGENISSFEVERVINSYPAVLESAVYSVPSDLAGDEEVMVSVVLQPEQSLEGNDLIAYCEDKMAYFMIPRFVRCVASLPKNAVLRVEKYKLRDEGVTPDTWDREKAGYKLKR